MPFMGLGLHILIAIYFAVHAVRSGQQMYWLIILFSFPLLGSVVYFVVIYLPDSRLQHGARKVVAAAGRALDPTRELRDARAAFDYTPTAQNRMRLAAALLDADQPEEAAKAYDACLKGPFANDLDIGLGAARAHEACGRHGVAVQRLDAIRAQDPAFRPEQVSLLLARALAGAGRHGDARSEFESALARFGSFEAKAEYAIWALGQGEAETAERLHTEIQRSMSRWSRHNRQLNAPLLRRLEEARAASAAAARRGG